MTPSRKDVKRRYAGSRKEKSRAGTSGRARARPERRIPLRPFWSGTISFGLISVPVRLYPATRRTSVSLRMLADDGTPLKRRYHCPLHDRVVEAEEIVRGYEVEEGEFVVMSDEELEAAEPRKSREIDLERFVDLAAIPPLFFDRAYFLTPEGDSNKAYRLLAEVMEATERAGIATFVMRNREYLVAILAERGILRAETLRFEEEVRSPDDVGLPDDADDPEPDALREFRSAIQALAADELDPDEMTDDHPRLLRELAEKKRKKGRDVVDARGAAREEDAPQPVPESDDEEDDGFREIDLLETIRLSLHGRDGGSNGGNGGIGGDGESNGGNGGRDGGSRAARGGSRRDP